MVLMAMLRGNQLDLPTLQMSGSFINIVMAQRELSSAYQECDGAVGSV